MKVFAHHDADGRIRALVAVEAPQNAGMRLTPKAGTFVAEIEGIEVRDARDGDALREIARSHVIETPLPRAKLVKKVAHSK